MPVPDSDSVACEILLLKIKLADAAPEACGLKVAVNDTLLPAPMVTGNARPVRENSESLTLAEETTTLAPEALRVPVLFALDPTVTLPKLSDPGETLRPPEEPAVPVKGTVKAALFEITEMLPLTVVVLVGVKVTLSVMLCPGVKVSGNPGPVKVN